MFQSFERKVIERLERMEDRISNLEREKYEEDSSRMLKARVVPQSQPETLRVSTKSVYYNESLQESAIESSFGEGIESNLEEKVRMSIINENWDEAFTLALTNNRKNILLNLLQRGMFPSDRTVEECILLEIKKLLGYTSALKWLKYYLSEKTLSVNRLLKLK